MLTCREAYKNTIKEPDENKKVDIVSESFHTEKVVKNITVVKNILKK